MYVLKKFLTKATKITVDIITNVSQQASVVSTTWFSPRSSVGLINDYEVIGIISCDGRHEMMHSFFISLPINVFG